VNKGETLIFDPCLGAFTNKPFTKLVNQSLVAGQNIHLSTDAQGRTIISGNPSAASASTIVANITARDALTPVSGQSVYVTDTGQGEWGLYIWTGSVWALLTSQDSSVVDAKTLTATFTYATSTQAILLGDMSGGTKAIEIQTSVAPPFNGTYGISVGTLANHVLISDGSELDLTKVGIYMETPDFTMPLGPVSPGETPIYVFVTNSQYGSTGSATLTLTYV
jgi:hypothetical protein